MDAVFYDALDAAVAPPQPQLAAAGVEKLRCSMTLNLQEPRPPPRNPLSSPDLQLLKLSSPELERLIIQSCSGLTPGSAAATPAPAPGRLFPQRAVTDEQEGFADGFVRALAELHSQQLMPCVPGADGHPGAAPPTCAGFGEQVWDGYADPPIGPSVPPTNFQCTGPLLKEEPQRVPETPPLSPIDMEDQERIKAERKRMRNRVAASKCRKRKLERLARLEERVSRLSGENGELRTVAQALRDQVLHLRHELLEHIKSGCKQLSQQLHTVKDF